MWTSLCNFLCNKLFHHRKIGFQQRRDSSEDIYGKRLKLVDGFWDTNDAIINNTSSSMQKENVEISDDEEECSIIAEIPRSNKGWSFTEPKNKYGPASFSIEGNHSFGSLPSFTFRGSSLDKIIDDREVKFLGRSSESDEATRFQVKKFFNSQRVCCSYGKVAKSRLLYKNQLKRKMNFLQESYRLTEKFQYMQLLQSHTTLNLLTVRPPLRSVECPSATIEVIDLTDEKTNNINKSSNSVTESKPGVSNGAGYQFDLINEVTTKTNSDIFAEDKDVEIVKEVSGVRSFQDLLKMRPVNVDVAVTKLLSGHSKSSPDVKLSSLPENIISVVDEDFTSQKTEALEEKLRNFMLNNTSEVQEVEILSKKSSLPELSSEQLTRIENALVPEPAEEILSQGFGLQIKRRDMQTLDGLNWLNDEIINFYCNLIMARSETKTRLPKVYAFNTFFYPNLVTNGYSSLRRWTKQVDIFSFDIILVPIHLGMHWCLSIIDFRSKSIRYYDSIGSPNDSCLESLLLYLKAEHLDKKKKIFSTTDWEKKNVDDIPQQMNGADCGVFSCMFAEFLSRGCSISFTQDDMPYFRKKIIIEILDKKLLT